MISLLIWLICVLLVAGAFLAVVRAIISIPPFAGLQPYTNVIYTIVVLIIILICISFFYNGSIGVIRSPRF